MSVSIDDCDFTWDEVHEEIRVATETLKCSACGERIEPGSRYVHWSACTLKDEYYEDDGVEDHQSGEYADEEDEVFRCMRCEAIFRHLQKRMGSGEEPDVRLNCGHDYRERWDEDPTDDVAALAFMTAKEAQKEFEP